MSASLKVVLKRHPRSIALVNSTDALVFRSTDPDGPLDLRTKCVMNFAKTDELDLSGFIPLVDCFGCLGLINIGNDVFLCTITSRSKAARPTPGRAVWRIHGVEFHCLTKPNWDFMEGGQYAAASSGAGSAPGSQAAADANAEHPCAGVRKLLVNGSFYYSTDFDLTAVLQNHGSTRNFTLPLDESFMWNMYMMAELTKFRSRLPSEEQEAVDNGGFLTCVIRGFASTVAVHLDSQAGLLSVISRQSWRRAGTRFNSRGIDDDGNVANFVETETVLWLENKQQFGYVQLRGSVPVFWEQDVNLLGGKITITRSFEATQPAFNRHFEGLMERFGAVHCVDLLANKTGERDLSQAYRAHMRSEGPEFTNSVRYTHFDFHKEVATSAGYGAASKVVERVQDSMLEFGFYSYNPCTSQTETEQIGVFRTNCLDCLDRTNLVQQLISKDALDLFLDYYNIYPSDELWNKHSILWADNADQLSQIYAGTNALKSSYTRNGKMNLAGALADVTKSVSRLYVNNFVDKQRQSTIELLLGRAEGQIQITISDPINDYVQAELKKRLSEYSSAHKIQVFSGTFNVNGKTPTAADLTAWLFPKEMTQFPDLYMLGFQELVELTAGQILNADSSRRTFWEELVGQTLNRREHYVLLRSGQLVGTAVMLFVKRSEMSRIKQVEGTSKKTAFGGMTGNKGGVAVSFMYANTSMCFINSHLAAGSNNVEERHHDYKLLSSGLRFARGRKPKDHDTVIWLGDFNYRVDLPNETVRTMMEHNSPTDTIERLLERDQLISQMVKGETFPYYQEMPIRFMPTYKFDPGTAIYDTSEKARVPSWTDRILSRGTNIRPLAYNSVPSIRFSDHRPVYAIYDVTVTIVDEAKRESLFQELYERRRHQVGDASFLVNDTELPPATLTALGLPHPSTDSSKWWAGEGLASKVGVQPPKPAMALNPDKVNPFSAAGARQPDFVDLASIPTQNSETASVRSGRSGRANSVLRKPVSSSTTSQESLLDAPAPDVPGYKSLI